MNTINKPSLGEQSELEKIKEEILSEIKGGGKKKRISWGSSLVTAALILLLVISLAQTVEAMSILNKMESGALKASGDTSSGGGSLPSGLQSLPDMVGGC